MSNTNIGGYLRVEASGYGPFELVPCDKQGIPVSGLETTLFQADYDCIGLASSLGMSLGRAGSKCQHRGTDGTVDCPDCGKKAIAFIGQAVAFLDRLNGKIVSDKTNYFWVD